MKRLIIALPLLLAFVWKCGATPLQDVQPTVMWGVVNQKGDTSYLFGVLHDLGDSYFDKYPIIKTELRKTNCIVMENTLFGDNETADTAGRQWYRALPDGDYDLINNYIKEKAKNYSKNAHMTLKDLEKAGNSPLEIYATVLQLSVCDQCNIHLKKGEQPVEQYLKDWCTYHNGRHDPIPLVGLEKAGDVTMSIFGFKEHDLLDSIKRVILHPLPDASDCDLVAVYWNMSGYNYNFSVPSQTADASNTFLLDERNNKWMPKIRALLDKDKTFIAVGLLHLAYKNGLINQLTTAGYRVFPVKME